MNEEDNSGKLDNDPFYLNSYDFRINDGIYYLNKRFYKLDKTIFDYYGGYGPDELKIKILENKHKFNMFRHEEYRTFPKK